MHDKEATPEKKRNFRSQDPLVEVNLGTEEEPRITKVSGLLPKGSRDQLVLLIRRYWDCFAWDYHEMPGLFCELVKRRLPIKEGYKPHKQLTRRFNPELLPKIKGEVERLLKTWFIRTARYIN